MEVVGRTTSESGKDKPNACNCKKTIFTMWLLCWPQELDRAHKNMKNVQDERPRSEINLSFLTQSSEVGLDANARPQPCSPGLWFLLPWSPPAVSVVFVDQLLWPLIAAFSPPPLSRWATSWDQRSSRRISCICQPRLWGCCPADYTETKGN